MKNPYKVQSIFSQNSRKDRMTHFNISIAVKRRWQWSALFRIFRNVKPLPMLLTNIKFSVLNFIYFAKNIYEKVHFSKILKGHFFTGWWYKC